MLPPEMTSEQVSENMGPIWLGPCFNPNVHATYSVRGHMKCSLLWLSLGTFSHRSPGSSFLTAWQQSSVVASTGRAARVSCLSDVRPRLNSATNLVTVELDGALSP